MKTYSCRCGNVLFFHNDRCLSCGAVVGMCPCCHEVHSMRSQPKGLMCDGEDCGVSLQRCKNAIDHGICNRLVPADEAVKQPLCDLCRLTTVVPDLGVPGNVELWRRLEHAKQRVLHTMQRNGFAPDPAEQPPLSFEFKADVDRPVLTGHQDGRITINVREADSVAREIARVNFGEPQRTLIGHIRHELGHYFWERRVKQARLDEFRRLFGDESDPDYATAMQRYYDQGPPPEWRKSFVSAYATMHPWEDFAETFGAYHDMLTVLGTANHFGITRLDLNVFDGLIAGYIDVGVMANEFNRDMGLLDLVPEVFVPAVVAKLRFVHSLRDPASS